MAERLLLEMPDAVLDQLADRVAARIAEREAAATAEPAGWLPGGKAIADYIGAPSSRVCALASCKPSRIPVERDGSALIARRLGRLAPNRRRSGPVIDPSGVVDFPESPERLRQAEQGLGGFAQVKGRAKGIPGRQPFPGLQGLLAPRDQSLQIVGRGAWLISSWGMRMEFGEA